jgi:ferredoxin
MNFNNTEYQTQPNESVLDLLLRHAKQINYSCKNGHCQSCILQVIEGNVESAALKDLKDTATKQGHFLACQQKAHLIKQATYADIQSLFSPARLIDKSFYCDDICRIQIETTTP